MVNRRWLAALAGVLLVSGAGLSAWLLSGGSHSEAGPLVLPAPGKVSIGAPIAMGKPVSYGLLEVKNNSANPLVLDRAELVRPGSGIVLLGAFGLPVPSKTKIGLVAGFRVPSDGHRLRGLTIAPHAELQIVLGMKLATPGSYTFQAIALRYHDDHGSYRDSYPASGRLCSPVKKYLENCKGLLL
jgi:hypothetical protein